MEDLTSLVDWSRAQFALTAIYHYLFVPLTLGLSFIIAIMETKYVVTGDGFYKKMVKFWMRLFGINFAIGVATGIILEFEFGTNWSNYSYMVGDIFGAPLAIEGILAFFMESTFIAVMFFGWDKVGKKAHLTATWLTAIGANLSAFWILVANAWMEFPTGMVFNPVTARCELINFWDVISIVAINKFSHTVTSGFVLSALFVIGVSAWYILKGREKDFAKKSIRLAAWFGLVGSLAVIGTGHLSGQIVARIQPMKLAAMENLHHGQKSAPFSVVPGVEIPGMLSLMANGDMESFVPGIEDIVNGYTDYSSGRPVSHTGFDAKRNMGNLALGDFVDCQKAMIEGQTGMALSKKLRMKNLAFKKNLGQYMGYAYLSEPQDLVPPIWPVYWSFRVMVGLGMWFLLCIFVWLWSSYKHIAIVDKKWWLKLSILTIFLAYLASECGWVVTEVGRQPWVIQGLLPTKVSVSNLSSTSVITTFAIFAVLFTVLLCAEISIMIKQIKKGPESIK